VAANPEWEVPFQLVTPQGTLLLNDDEQVEGSYLLDMAGCSMGLGIRAEKYGVPQGDGDILRRRFTTGYGATLLIEYWDLGKEQPACVSSSPSSRAMNDTIMRHLRSILNGGGRLLWLPTGQGIRMIDNCHLLEGPTVAETNGLTTCSFTLDSIYPYAQDFTQQLTQFDAGDPEVIITNTGTADYWPVWKVYGPADHFTILNITSNEEIVYNSDLPGAPVIPPGSYAEINTFRNTIYMNGNGANLKPGLDIELTNFFPLYVGPNDILITGDATDPSPDVDCLWAPAWF
jgi:hypothetical protein